ncbi:conserved hypothetical protein [Streptomyces sp. SPB78]|uniref:hypothetical protein n=1 Tax=unclassified Streptomyces TaxID=2593676 RepID=UPI0001B58426|nr:hypothetical protein [Streptomyces sp. SPB78]EFL00499.1 conserved hypothetical protein [Streptomyces sp. SPB78]
MSDFAGSVHPATTSGPAAIAGTPGTAGTTGTPGATGAGGTTGTAGTVQESYSFACMRCGHGWEQAYEIERHADPDGHPYVVYLAGGERVPSPLSSPSCLNCGGGVVRIMRAGRVTSAASQAHTYGHGAAPAKSRTAASARSGEAGASGAEGAEGAEPSEAPHHWHVLADLLHVFHRQPPQGR